MIVDLLRMQPDNDVHFHPVIFDDHLHRSKNNRKEYIYIYILNHWLHYFHSGSPLVQWRPPREQCNLIWGQLLFIIGEAQEHTDQFIVNFHPRLLKEYYLTSQRIFLSSNTWLLPLFSATAASVGCLCAYHTKIYYLFFF